ncbi:glycine betaine/L-proline ABC transporter ATP-binding protein [Synechococcus sp. Nb3U1]|uniref:quaternary amine ABC transporter ATP-binding protein n=1 Tax=Synechococcus sp. Nb3U1 TaxID=1914529 RepID=UPI001F480343|nr:glycine betaine/L-proline ABC transporter ATP-binding protein [Synechococcus sp. Nb3U1]MCF2970574.1 glycine betaine/L-proline ABC transporter ATP-binding protein [Synechococcus sp. Nb3U1]
MSASEPKIRIEHLTKIYGPNPPLALAQVQQGLDREALLQSSGHVLAVADISLTIERGELFVIMGLSGSGKSTLVRCLNRLIQPTCGRVYVDGEDILRVGPGRLRQIRRQTMGMVFQKFALFPHRTVLENVEYGLKIQGIAPQKRRQRGLETLEMVGLQQWAERYPADLSGGMQQRVGLARALATDPDILLMDEAFSALDPLIRREMQQELLKLQERFHKTIVFITHDIQEALKIGDRVAMMRDGALVQVGSPSELLTQPADDYVRQFIQEVNRAQVLKTGSITRRTLHLILGQDSLQAAAEQMRCHELNTLYVLDGQGRPVGVLTPANLERSLQMGHEELQAAMQTDFPQVQASTSLEDLFLYWDREVPIAVVDREGRFKGVVEQSELFSVVGRLNPSPRPAQRPSRDPQTGAILALG